MHFSCVTLVNSSLNLLINAIHEIKELCVKNMNFVTSNFCEAAAAAAIIIAVCYFSCVSCFPSVLFLFVALPIFFMSRKKFPWSSQPLVWVIEWMHEWVTEARTVHLSKTIKCNKIIFPSIYRVFYGHRKKNTVIIKLKIKPTISLAHSRAVLG